MIWGIVLGLGLIIFVFLYNGLISKKNQVINAFSGIDVQLKKRHDLIPNIIASVKTFMTHEKSLLDQITRLRTEAMSTKDSDKQIEIESMLSKALGKVNLAVESYPDLKSDSGFQNLQRSLNEVESQISAARRSYNSAATAYNNGLEMFPSNFIAQMMGLKLKALFEASDEEKLNINVSDHF